MKLSWSVASHNRKFINARHHSKAWRDVIKKYSYYPSFLPPFFLKSYIFIKNYQILMFCMN